MDLIEVESLILLLQELAFADVGEEKLFSEIGPVPMYHLDPFQQLRGLLILSKGREDEDQVLDREGIFLVLRLDLVQEVLTLAMLLHFHLTVGLDCVVEGILWIL